ncbi:CDK5 regulatory subunit-associated 1 [Brachionus plicatilis]|uniref:CDK5 regulatory subunit-associated 1 n=1 Tax=Brachionus plicatilis TaxID=10195 RepID=A0A3M7SH23_BRAPC|nr:CDK5 regulatory subunit-associated 1 [Brachionus plicatilis]
MIVKRFSPWNFRPNLFSQIRYLSSQNTKFEKHAVKDGLNLKDFIKSASLAEFHQPNSAEESSNAIFLKNIKKHQEYLDDSTNIGTKRKVYFEVHGCQMNINDTEVAYSVLDKTGLYSKTDNEKDADIVLIMTCSIRENAEQKIWNRLREFLHQKRLKKDLQIGILGCMAERLKEKILDKEKMVDIVCGPDSYRLLPELLNQSVQTGNSAMNVQLSLEETYADLAPLRINTNNKNAFISIQRGCDNMCSFCIVPFVRGRERSRPIQSIIDEIKRLSDQGIKEVTLLGQNVNSYRDLSISVPIDKKIEMSKGFKTIYRPKIGGKRFTDLLYQASEVNPEMRIRFTSPHPKDFPDDLLFLMKEKANICKTIHLPAQSGSTACLERMRRGYTREAYLDLVTKIRQIIPQIAFTSDFIAGFCAETEQEHADTISLLKLVNYTFCFMYTYSMREKTRAYHRFTDDVPNDVKQRRYLEMVEVFRQTAAELNKSKIGQTHLVLIDQISKRSKSDYSGRNDNNTLVNFEKREIFQIENWDDLVKLKNGEDHLLEKKVPTIGDYVACRLTSATSQSFRAEPVFMCKLQTFNKIKDFI